MPLAERTTDIPAAWLPGARRTGGGGWGGQQEVRGRVFASVCQTAASPCHCTSSQRLAEPGASLARMARPGL